MPNPVLPVVGFLMKVGLGKAAAFAVASFAVNTAATLAINTAIGALTRKKAPAQERQAQVTTLSIGEVPREAVFGITAIGGSLVDVFNWGGQHGTDRVTMCIALADHACDGMQGYFVGDEYHRWTGNGPQAAFGGKLILEFRNATEDGWAPPADAVAHGGWTATDRGCSVTHMWVTVVYDEKVWPQGLPRFRWEVRGLHPFDPRRGDHDPGDPTTWTFSRNPILERYTWARGIYATGKQGQPEHLLIGRGLSAEEAPPDRIIGWANLCDEHIDGLPRYFCDGVIQADLDHIEVEEMFATAMAGTIVQREGGVEIEPGHAKATVVTITDDDLVVGEPVEYSAFRPDSDGGRINTVIPRYVSVAQRYTDHSGPVRRDLADITRDGGPREMTLVLPLVTNGAVADRNAEIARRLARLERRASIVLPPEYSRLEEGDWIAWRSDRRHGGATVRYRVEAWSLDEAWRMHLSLREIAASVYGEPDPVDDPVPPPPPPNPPDALALTNVSVEAITLPGDETTSTVPAIRFRWGDPVEGGGVRVDPAVRAIRAEVRRNTADPLAPPQWVVSPTQTDDVVAGELITTNGVGPNQRVQCRLVPVGEPWRPVAPSPWVEVTTGDLIATDVSRDGAIWRSHYDTARRVIQNSIDDVRALLDEEERREIGFSDTLGRLDLGFRLDPVTGTALIRQTTVAEGVGPDGEAQTLVQMADRLVTADAQVLLAARAYTDDYRGQAELVFATKVEREDGDAATLIAAESYTDQAKTWAELTFSTIAAREAGDAQTLIAAKSYADDKEASANLTFATKTERSVGDALALLQAKAYTDDYASSANLTFATQSALGDVSATAGIALSTAQDAKAQLNEAAVRIVAEASGAQPAMIDLYSGTRGSRLGLVAGELWLVNVANGAFIPAMKVAGGDVEFTNNVKIHGDLVVAGTITTPRLADKSVTDGASASIGGPMAGGMGVVNAITLNVVMAHAGRIDAIAVGTNSYTSSGDPAIMFALRIAGSDVYSTGGSGLRIASMAAAGYMDVPAGTHQVQVRWSGAATSVNLSQCTLVVRKAYR